MAAVCVRSAARGVKWCHKLKDLRVLGVSVTFSSILLLFFCLFVVVFFISFSGTFWSWKHNRQFVI